MCDLGLRQEQPGRALCSVSLPRRPPALAAEPALDSEARSAASSRLQSGPTPERVPAGARSVGALGLGEGGGDRTGGQPVCGRWAGVPAGLGSLRRARPSSFPGKGLHFPDALPGRKSSRNSMALDEGHGSVGASEKDLGDGAVPRVPGVPGGGQALLPRAPGTGAVSAPERGQSRPAPAAEGAGLRGVRGTQLRGPRSRESPVPARAPEDGPGVAVSPASSPTGRPRGFAVTADQAARTGQSAHGGSCVRRGRCGCPGQPVGLAPLGDTQLTPKRRLGPSGGDRSAAAPAVCIRTAPLRRRGFPDAGRSGHDARHRGHGVRRGTITRALHARARCVCSTRVHTCVSARARLRVRVGVVRARAARLCVRRVCAGGALAALQLPDSLGDRSGARAPQPVGSEARDQPVRGEGWGL